MSRDHLKTCQKKKKKKEGKEKQKKNAINQKRRELPQADKEHL